MTPGLLAAPVLLAIDDTDGPRGGCTTHMLYHVLLALPELVPLGLPRLVRLNPNVPWKTRGNGAVCVRLGDAAGAHAVIGELHGHELHAFPDGSPAEPTEAHLEAVWRAVSEAAQDGAHPAVALLPDAPGPWPYWAAVRTVVEPDAARRELDGLGARHRSAGDGRGLVGCLAAASWPGPPASYEFLAYRMPERTGTPRALDEAGLRSLDGTGVTFHTIDPESGRLACVPSTPDPVLCGLRGHDPDTLRDAAVHTLLNAAQEPVEGWLLYATNQASGDHVTPVDSLAEAPELGTVAVAAVLAGRAETGPGGHVFAACRDAAGTEFAIAAFEPTKGLRDVVRALRPGDAITAVGGLADGVVKLEKVEVRSLAESVAKRANPTCPECGRSMKSRGRGTGYRCPDGHAEADDSQAEVEVEDREVATGWHEAPVMARRHLHRPLGFDQQPHGLLSE